MRKKLMTIAAIIAAALPAVAGETDIVTVEPINGAAYSAAIASVARVTFTDDAVRLVSAADGSVFYSSPIAETSRVDGLADGSPIFVHSLSGALVLMGTAPTVSLPGLQSGLYIVVAGDAAVRLTVK